MGLGARRGPSSAKPDPKVESFAKDRAEERLVEAGTIGAGQSYMISVWSDGGGKVGCGVKCFGEPRNGEDLEQVAKRLNHFAVLKLREVETALSKEGK